MDNNWKASDTLLSAACSFLINLVNSLVLYGLVFIFSKFAEKSIVALGVHFFLKPMLSIEILAVFGSAIETILTKMIFEFKTSR